LANKKVLVNWLRAQSRNRTEQAEARRKDHVPDTHLMARFRDEASMLAQAADLCEKSEDYGNGPAITDEQSQRTSVNEQLMEEGNPLANSEREPLVASPPTPPKNKGGRPRKMTLAEIEKANQGAAHAVNDKD